MNAIPVPTALSQIRIFAFVGLLLASLTLVQPAKAAAPSEEQAVVKFEHEWANTWIKGDVKAMEQMLTEDFTEVDPSGTLLNRAQHIQGFKSGKFKIQSLVLGDLRVRFHGNIAIVTGTADDKATFEGKDISGRYTFTDVLVRRNGKWLAASTQSTRITK